jgi:hypothetical protein
LGEDPTGTPIYGSNWAGSGNYFSVSNTNLPAQTQWIILPAMGPDPFYDHDQGKIQEGLDPVQFASGSETRHKHLFSLRGARDWDFDLSYNSLLSSMQSAYVPMGLGWSHNFQANIAVSGSNLIVNWNQASRNDFLPVSGSTGVYTSSEDGGLYDTIVVQSGGGWLLTRRDQSSLLFNSSGQLVVDSDSHDRKLNLSYTSGQLTGITDPISSTSLTLAVGDRRHLGAGAIGLYVSEQPMDLNAGHRPK